MYQTDEWCKRKVVNEVEEFFLDNDMASYLLGVYQDFKHFGFAVSVIILNKQGNKVVRVLRKEACYVRFAPANKEDVIPSFCSASLGGKIPAAGFEPTMSVSCRAYQNKWYLRQCKYHLFFLISDFLKNHSVTPLGFKPKTFRTGI